MLALTEFLSTAAFSSAAFLDSVVPIVGPYDHVRVRFRSRTYGTDFFSVIVAFFGDFGRTFRISFFLWTNTVRVFLFCHTRPTKVVPSASFLAKISVRSPQKIPFFIILKTSPDQNIQKNMLFNVEKVCTGSAANNSITVPNIVGWLQISTVCSRANTAPLKVLTVSMCSTH